jgi:hypothetical protein
MTVKGVHGMGLPVPPTIMGDDGDGKLGGQQILEPGKPIMLEFEVKVVCVNHVDDGYVGVEYKFNLLEYKYSVYW